MLLDNLFLNELRLNVSLSILLDGLGFLRPLFNLRTIVDEEIAVQRELLRGLGGTGKRRERLTSGIDQGGAVVHQKHGLRMLT